MGAKTKIPESRHQEMIDRYQAGESTESIGKDLGVHRSTVASWLTELGVQLDQQGGVAETDDARQQKIVSMYQGGVGATTIAREVGVSKKTVYNILNRLGVGTRPKEKRSDPNAETRVAMVPRTYSKTPKRRRLREDAFDDLDQGACYWAGFLAADGCLSKERGKSSWRIFLTQGERDKAHLQQFLRWLKSDVKLVKHNFDDEWGKRTTFSAAVTSRAMGERLLQLGMQPSKGDPSVRDGCCYDEELASSAHFWRGMVDGDGFLVKGRDELGLYAGTKVRNQFKTFLSQQLGEIKCFERSNQHGVTGLIISGEAARDAALLLYGGLTIPFVLPRKFLIASRYMGRMD